MMTKLSFALVLGTIVGTTSLRVVAGDPRIDSWFTDYSGLYGRIYETAAAQAAGTRVATWGNGSQNQNLPAYAGVQQVLSSTNWIYIRTTGLGIHTMGPWPAGFPNLPKNQKVFYRLPRAATVPAEKTLTGLGAIGYYVDGVAMFDSRDAFYWNGSTETQGAGYWNREAYVNEGATFDPANAHQENTGMYHYHANPIALRYLLGDHVDYDKQSKTYIESSEFVTAHSPILGWVSDGYPIYGPYGYSSASNSASAIRRMVSGYQVRNGDYGSDNLTTLGRRSIPKWAARLYSVNTNVLAGPDVSTTYPLGRYMEDNVYLGDLGLQQGVDFDLDQYNGRWCVTPEYPEGTYAYFVALKPDGNPAFPYNIGRAFYGTPTGGAVTSLAENVTTNFLGGPDNVVTLSNPFRTGTTVDLVWSAAEGGTYRLEASSALNSPTDWKTVASNIVATNTSATLSAATGDKAQFYRAVRTALADYDPVIGGGSGGNGSAGILTVSPSSAARGTTFTLTINLDPAAQPAPPPQMAPINSVTVGSIAGSGNTHVSQTQVTSTIMIPANAATGSQTVTVVFPGPPENQTQTVTYTLVDGFTIN